MISAGQSAENNFSLRARTKRANLVKKRKKISLEKSCRKKIEAMKKFFETFLESDNGIVVVVAVVVVVVI